MAILIGSIIGVVVFILLFPIFMYILDKFFDLLNKF